MSGYRPQQMPAWRVREMARKAAAEEEERRKKTEVNATNFPALSSATPVQTTLVTGTGFAELASKWAKDEETDRQMFEYRKSQAEAERRQYESLYRIRSSQQSLSRYDDEEEDEEEKAPPSAPAAAGAEDDDGGWIEVKNKVRKPKRELTIAEMEARDRRKDTEEEQAEFNAELYETGRHDHDRV